MTNRYDQLSDRARWFLNNFDELDLADICAAHEASNQTREAEITRLRQGLADVIADMNGTTGARHWIAALDRILNPAADTGPTVAEAAKADRLWPLQKAGE